MTELKAIFFDQDGVIIDTEKDGHRVAFNKAFKEYNYDFVWGANRYYELLQVAGGKERMRRYFQEEGLFSDWTKGRLNNLIAELHKRKTEIFISLIESGQLPLRAGIKRFMQEAQDTGLILGICTTSNERSANAIINSMLEDIYFEFILSGDIVSYKKPDPEIYSLALMRSGLSPEECIAIEDSRNGLLAARAAGLRVVVTTNIYTEHENFSEASIVVSSLGDPDGEKGILKKSIIPFDFDGLLRVDHLIKLFNSGRVDANNQRKTQL